MTKVNALGEDMINNVVGTNDGLSVPGGVQD
jgi:hypothetical protein